ncbi:MAG: hypothetical protein QNI99_04035 [Woeseiaceae bacterium]|nr:hypothetical protein [Woeseiaceae bacterium]
MLLTLTFCVGVAGVSVNRDDIEPEVREYARGVVNSLSELSEEQFNAYWGPEPPGSPDQREFIIEWTGQLGHLEQINAVELKGYTSMSTLRTGTRHTFTYRIDATYSNGEATVVMPVLATDETMVALNIFFFSEVLGNMAELEALEN